MEDEMDKEKYTELLSEYEKFKKENVKHFEFSSASSGNNFGKQILQWRKKTKLFILLSGKERVSTLQLVQIYFETTTFDDIERDKKIKTEGQLSLIGGTMGLLTGFSIISGIEIIFYLFRLICSPISGLAIIVDIINNFQYGLFSGW